MSLHSVLYIPSISKANISAAWQQRHSNNKEKSARSVLAECFPGCVPHAHTRGRDAIKQHPTGPAEHLLQGIFASIYPSCCLRLLNCLPDCATGAHCLSHFSFHCALPALPLLHVQAYIIHWRVPCATVLSAIAAAIWRCQCEYEGPDQVFWVGHHGGLYAARCARAEPCAL